MPAPLFSDSEGERVMTRRPQRHSPNVELTKFTKIGGPLTKRILLGPDGKLVSDGSACVMAQGVAERVRVASVSELATLIEKLSASQAIALGALRTSLPDKVEVISERNLNGVARPDIIARTGANIVYQGPAFALLDFDTKGMPPAVTAQLKQLGGFWLALLSVLPALGGMARVTRRSTSSGLSRTDTGRKVAGSDGVHLYIKVNDGDDVERFLRALHARCWLAGLGWYMVSANGALLERSIVDRMVGGPERLVFEGGPVLVPPLKQDKESRRPVAVDGSMLDTVTACPPLTIVETAKLEDMKARERQRLAPEMAKARAKFVGVQAKRLAERTGKSEQDARKIIERQYEGVLNPDVVLPFDDEKLAGKTVRDVLANPEFYEGETLADPLEGVDYGRCVAKIMRRSDGTPWIHSFAHGRTIYELKRDAATVRRAMQGAAKNDVVATFVKLAVDADVDAVELEELRQLAKKLSGVGLMTKLPTPEQWVLARMDDKECAELIEQHIDFYVENEDGFRRSVHLPSQFVAHYLQRHDGALPTVVAIATAPFVLADGILLAPDGLDRDRGIVFIIPKELRAIVPERKDCTKKAVKAAMDYLTDEWLCDVATDYAGKCIIIAAALTLVERTLLPDRPVFFVTAGRRGGGKTTTLTMLIMAITGLWPAAAAWSTNEEERRKALMSYFLYGVPYILWDNIARGTQISCPHIEKSCTAAYYSDRKLGVSQMVCTAASAIHFFTGNNIGPRGDLASRSLRIRLDVDRADPENRPFKHPDAVGWTKNHRAEILAALFAILLGNPQLKQPRNAEGKTRFKMWWRLVGSAVEHGAELVGHKLDFKSLFIVQEEDDEESASLADVLDVLAKQWSKEFTAKDVAELINSEYPDEDQQMVRDYLLPGTPSHHMFSAKTVARLLKRHLDEPVRSGARTLALRSQEDKHTKMRSYHVHVTAT
jgi:hypothetical protein